MRLVPRSLTGQMAVLIGAALLLAQLVSFAYLLVERKQFTRSEIDTPAITRFTSTAADAAQAAPEFQLLVLHDASRRGAQYAFGQAPVVGDEASRRSDTEDRLRQSLTTAGLGVQDVRAAIDVHAPVRRRADGRPRRAQQSMLLSAQLPDGRWLNGRVSVPAPPPLVSPELAVGTILLYLFVLTAALLIATRIARPLRRLTNAAEAFRGSNEPVVVEPRGPSDLRDAILAFNAMNARLVKLLEEKDRTLGAIGHDLRTPLTSLRIRAESVEPAEDRERMIATIEEMTATLEDILVLARSGRSRDPLERTDVAALAEALADEYRQAGQEVAFAAGGAQVMEVQPNLLRRAIRNLIDNALKYGGGAEVAVTGDDDSVRIAVLDRGPGLPADEIARITGAFYRAEPSRNRGTGGAGLGLAIAEAIVEGHGGKLTFANRDGGGLAATVCLPR
ncbi:signal transduction histidine kinase [Sphingomonas sp. F9_3S_D5_B_2]